MITILMEDRNGIPQILLRDQQEILHAMDTDPSPGQAMERNNPVNEHHITFEILTYFAARFVHLYHLYFLINASLVIIYS